MSVQWAFQSRHLLNGAYDVDTQTLEVQFYNGAVYRYYGVPPTVADNLRQTGSSRDYFNDKIRNGPYRYVQVAEGTTKSGRRSVRWRF